MQSYWLIISIVIYLIGCLNCIFEFKREGHNPSSNIQISRQSIRLLAFLMYMLLVMLWPFGVIIELLVYLIQLFETKDPNE